MWRSSRLPGPGSRHRGTSAVIYQMRMTGIGEHSARYCHTQLRGGGRVIAKEFGVDVGIWKEIKGPTQGHLIQQRRAARITKLAIYSHWFSTSINKMKLTIVSSILAIGLGFVTGCQIPDQSPIITLPYGRWKAVYDNNTDIYTFRNIRFAAPPIGNLRFAKPDPPKVVHGIQNGSYGPQCFQGRSLSGQGSSGEVVPNADTTNFTLNTEQAEGKQKIDWFTPAHRTKTDTYG